MRKLITIILIGLFSISLVSCAANTSPGQKTEIELTEENFSDYFILTFDIDDLETRFEWDTLDTAPNNGAIYYQQRATARYHITTDIKKEFICENVVIEGKISISDFNFKTTTPIFVKIEVPLDGQTEYITTIESTNKLAYTTKTSVSGVTLNTELGNPITLPKISDIKFEITSINGVIVFDK